MTRIPAIMALAFLAALVGVLAGRTMLAGAGDRAAGASIFDYALHDLELSAPQRAAVLLHQDMFVRQRARMEASLQADNRRLSDAIEREHANGPLVQAAILRSHATMGNLQTATLDHLFAVRGVLRPDQARKFDAKVREVLTSGHQ